MTTRQRIQLTSAEFSQYDRLPPVPGAAFAFWREVAAARGLDPATVFSYDGTMQNMKGLPLGHGKPWCWPSNLKCKRRPNNIRY